jgi:hypothetical protein
MAHQHDRCFKPGLLTYLESETTTREQHTCRQQARTLYSSSPSHQRNIAVIAGAYI